MVVPGVMYLSNQFIIIAFSIFESQIQNKYRVKFYKYRFFYYEMFIFTDLQDILV